MATPEVPRYRFEKQTEVYKLPKGIDKIDWSNTETDVFKVGAKENFFTALEKAILKKMVETSSDEEDPVKNKKEAKYKANVIFLKAIHDGFNSSLIHENEDEFRFTGGVLYIKTSLNKNWVKLDQKAEIPQQYIDDGYTEAKPEAIHKTRRAWQNLQEAFKQRILYDVLLALTGGNRQIALFKNRKLIWNEMRAIDPTMGSLVDEDYNGHTPHQKKMIDFLNRSQNNLTVLDRLSKATGIKFLHKAPPSEVGTIIGADHP